MISGVVAEPYRILRGNTPFALLACGQGLSSLADWLLAVVLTVLAYGISHSTTTVSLLIFTRLAPYALVLPWSGLILDRADRRLVMTGIGLGRGLCMLGLLFVHSPATLPLAFPLVFVSASLSCLLRPTVNATLPGLVLERQMIAANGIMGQIDGLGHAVGPALAATFFLIHNPSLALVVTAVVFALSGALLFSMRAPSLLRSTGSAGMDFRFGELLAGFRFIFRENERVLVALTAIAAGLALLAGAYYTLAVALCIHTFHVGQQGVGWLDAAYGAGGVAGGMFVGIGVRERAIGHLFILGSGLSSVGMALLALSPPGPAPFACSAGVGVADVVVLVTGTTILQNSTPRDILARAFTAFEAALVAAMLVGALAAGPLLRFLGPRGATLTFALAGGLVLLLALPLFRPLERVLAIRVFLRRVPLLEGLSRQYLDDLAPSVEVMRVPAGTVIVREGEPGDRLYIIQSGEVEVSVAGQVVRTVGPADYFGEVALLRDVPRTASVRASRPAALCVMDRSAFQWLLRHAGEIEPRLAGGTAAGYVYAGVPVSIHR